jgi:predicted Ser/Thr protein kinase
VVDSSIGLEATVVRTPSAPRGVETSGGLEATVVRTPSAPLAEAEQGAWEATVARDVLVGKQLGDFVVKRRIGAGGMGIVYEGEHPVIGRKVAIKILRPEFLEGAQARDLVAEARAASAIRHRGIIDIFGFGTIPGVGQYLVMEFLEGAPLDEVIDRRGPLKEQEVIALLDELLAALSAAHAAGVIHRDLKPGNIFVVRDFSGAESVKVLDFGLAKRSEKPHGSTSQTRASLIVGTPEFMAPEQACGQAVGPYTDLYAVGVIAFQMLTRRLPFEGDSPMAVAIQQVQAQPPAPSKFVDIHPAMDALVLRLLAKEVSERPASAEATRRELKSILRQLGEAPAQAGDSLSGTRVRGSSPAAPPNRRRWVLAMAAGVALLGGLAFLGLRQQAPPVAVATLGAASVPPRAEAAPAPEKPEETLTAVAKAPAVVSPQPPETPVKPSAAKVEEPPAVALPPPDEGGSSSTRRRRIAAARLRDGNLGEAGSRRVGTLKLVVRGWAHIYVDGVEKGEVPPIHELELPAGRHELLLVNPGSKPFRKIIKIKAGETLEQRVRFVKEP